MEQPAADQAAATARRVAKSDTAFRTISEVSEELAVPQHVLRFWESKFTQIKPLKRGGGRRYYRPEDMALLGRIRDLLYKDGYTIKGVQKLLRDSGVKAVVAHDGPPAAPGLPLDEPAQPVAAAPILPAVEMAAVAEMVEQAPALASDSCDLRAILEDLLELRDLLASALAD